MPSCLTQQSSTPLDHWKCAAVSGTKMSARDPVSCVLGPPQFKLVCLVNLKANAYIGNFFLCSSHPWNLFFFSLCIRAHELAERDHGHLRRASVATIMHSLVIRVKVTSTFLSFISFYLTRRCNFNQNDRRAINNLSSGSCSVALDPMVQPGPHPWPHHQFTIIPSLPLFWQRPLQTAILHRWIIYAYIGKAINRYEEAEIDVHLLSVSLWFLCQSERDTQE